MILHWYGTKWGIEETFIENQKIKGEEKHESKTLAFYMSGLNMKCVNIWN